MEVGAQDVYEKQFNDAWRGYNQEEVDDFLDKVAEALDLTQRENADLAERVRTLEESVSTAREAEEMLRKTLATAQQAAEEAMAKAKSKAENLVTEAEEQSRAATHEAHERVASLEADLRRRAREAEREQERRTHELQESIARLQAFEADLKHKLKDFLERQQDALQLLTGEGSAVAGDGHTTPARAGDAQGNSGNERPRVVVVAEPTGAPQAPSRPHDVTQEQGVFVDNDFPDFEPSQDPDMQPQYEHQRRGLRSLFHRDEE